MNFLVLILLVAPIYATGDVFGDLLGQEFQYVTIDHVREKRQAPQHYRPLNQAPPQVQQLLQLQDSRGPLVHIPQQQVPKLAPAQPIKPQFLSQQQAAAYKPQVTYASAAQQPNYKNGPFNPQYKKPIIPQQPQYRPIQPPQVPQPQYSSKLPPHIQQLLQYQQKLV